MSFIAPEERHVIGRVYGFAEILRSASAMPPDENEYFERPWKWTPEYEAWVGVGSPMPENPGWTRYLDALEELFALP
jgi:hypothetical protein